MIFHMPEKAENVFERLKYFPVRNKYVWTIIRPIVAFFVKLNEARNYNVTKNYNNKILNEANIHAIVNNLVVQNGPFKGMIYPDAKSAGSAIYPKLIGSYESELNTYIELACKRQYSDIIDIGCAEGYYAIGLALRNPKSKITAYDTNEKARKLCKEMAIANQVENRVDIKSAIFMEDILNLNSDGKILIISDCEGYEKELFNERTTNKLKNCDLIIEMHDNVDIDISTNFYNLFKITHDVIVVKSIDDMEKAKTYNFLPKDVSLSAKKIIYSERPFIMEWLICFSKQ
jgi:precorrin-6B methylase 2